MRVIQDQWTPFFKELSESVSERGRRRLLNVMIQDLENMTVENFGAMGKFRPQDWKILNAKYAEDHHDGDQTPTLILTGVLKDSFVKTVNGNSASLTNTCEYADEHLLKSYAKNKQTDIPARPYYPVTFDGQSLTEAAIARQNEILNIHFLVGNPF